jgi:sensor domain CHASE-containing protein
MTIRKKTVLIIGATGISLLLIFSVISYSIVLKSFIKIEIQYVQEHLQRTLRLINDDLDTLSKTLGDWAVWTANYNFMRAHI